MSLLKLVTLKISISFYYQWAHSNYVVLRFCLKLISIFILTTYEKRLKRHVRHTKRDIKQAYIKSILYLRFISKSGWKLFHWVNELYFKKGLYLLKPNLLKAFTNIIKTEFESNWVEFILHVCCLREQNALSP